MNIIKIKNYIEHYRNNFAQIHDMEIYKWRAIKHFQDNFNIDAADFHENLKLSLSKTGNLMDSGNYFPRRMILKNSKKSPEATREAFKLLFDQSVDIIHKINRFSEALKRINKNNFGSEARNAYQDQRAIIVYLCLQYPADNYFYKFRMFKDLVSKIDYPYTPKRGADENILQYYNLCEIIKSYIVEDHELIKLHFDRLSQNDYKDVNFNILTQDVIYAIADNLENTYPSHSLNNILREESFNIEIVNDEVVLNASKPDYLKLAQTNKRIGDFGELLVFNKLSKDYPNSKVFHDAKLKGDGLGYDIQILNPNGARTYIEVKTTTGDFNRPFYITASELKMSQSNSDYYYLYRVFNFNEITNEGKVKVIKGDLSEYCHNPIQFKVTLERKSSCC